MPQKLQTRLKYARPNDAQTLSKLFAASWHGAYRGIIPYQQLDAIIKRRNTNWWTNALSRHRNIILIIFDQEIIGYAHIGRLRNFPKAVRHDPAQNNTALKAAEVIELYIAPDYQGLGFGRQLFQGAYTELRKQGMQKLVVWALSENINACEFYLHLGGDQFANIEERFGTALLQKTGFKWTF